MLTPEDRLRIEEEERQRFEAEQYRTSYRAKLEQDTSGQKTPAKARGSRSSTGTVVAIVIALVITAIVGVAVLRKQADGGSDSPPDASAAATAEPVVPPVVRYVPVNDPIASGQITVPARRSVTYKIVVTPEMVDPVISGTFSASGGIGNDVRAVLADEMNYTNWDNGHEASVFWGTDGRKTTGALNVRLRPGTYILAFSNQMSLVSARQVFLDIHLNYTRKGTARAG